MNCTGVRKFLYAFADGQLGVKSSCEVLDHLKMCPACSRLVDEHHSLRAAIGRMLAARRRRTICEHAYWAIERAQQTCRIDRQSLRAPMRRMAASAACIVWRRQSCGGRFRRTGTSMTAQGPVRGGRADSGGDDAEVHRMCLARSRRHQYPTLAPRSSRKSPRRSHGISAAASRRSRRTFRPLDTSSNR